MWQRHGMGSPVNKETSIQDELTRIQLNQDRIAGKVSSINLKIQKIYDNYDVQVNNMEKKYDLLFVQMEQKQKDEEKLVLNKLNSDEIDAENFSAQIIDIREKYNKVEKNMIKEKFQTLDIMEKSMKESLDTLISQYEHDSEIKIVWNDAQSTYSAIINM